MINAYPQFANFLANNQQWSFTWTYAGTNPTLLKHLLNLLLYFNKFWLTWGFTRLSKHVTIFITKCHIFWVNLFYLFAGFVSSFLARAYKCKPTLSSLVIQQHTFYQLGWTQLYVNGWLYQLGLHHNTTTVPTLNGTLHITALPIAIARELYSICNPIYDRVMHLEPIDAKYNLDREVLAHITHYQQLKQAVPHASSKT